MTVQVDNIKKSPEDKRSYRGLILPNEIKVLLISDEATDHSLAALNVNVGYMSDPDELPGLAHFCEHMLFLGTKKYPEEGELLKYVNQHGGRRFAVTTSQETRYYLQVAPPFLTELLDRFAQMFIAPLFTESATEREINAINSEHQQVVPDHFYREKVLSEFLAAENHPYKKYGCGNKQTLWDIPKERGIDIREALLNFHGQWYSSNIMTLVVLGQESLDDLTKIVEDIFGEVENKKVEAPIRTDHPYTAEEFGTITKVVPLTERRILKIFFPMPDMRGLFKTGVDIYLSHLCGHEGTGSLLSALKSRGWSSKLGTNPIKEFAICIFVLELELTEEGLEHVSDVIKLVFQYLNMLKKEGPQQWIFDECSVISNINFRLEEMSLSLMEILPLTSNIQKFPLEEVLYAPYNMTEYNPEIINSVLDNFTPDKVRVMVIAKIYEPECTSTEPYLGVKYHSEKLSKNCLEEFQAAELCPELKLPAPNEFIPTNFSLIPQSCVTPHPQIILDTPHLRLWFKQDSEYLTPKIIINILLATPLVNLDPLYFNLTHVFVKLFYDSLNEYSYSALISGLLWNIKATRQGIIINFSGFNSKMDILLARVLANMKNLKIDENRFKVLHENYKNELSNFKMQPPLILMDYYMDIILSQSSWSKETLLEACEYNDVASLKSFLGALFSKLHVEMLVQGNSGTCLAKKMACLVEESLNINVGPPLYADQIKIDGRDCKLEPGKQYLFNVENIVHSAMAALYECGTVNTANNMLAELLVQILAEPCFRILRGQEQLGYAVRCTLRRSNGAQGLLIFVKSERPPAFVDSRIEAFVEAMKWYLESMTNEDFERHKQSLTSKRLQKAKTLSDSTELNWNEIIYQQYHFDRNSVDVDYLKNISKEEFVSFFNETMTADSSNRRKLAIYMISKKNAAGNQDQSSADYPIQKYEVITDVFSFKDSMELYPIPKPYKDIIKKGKSHIL